MFHLSIIVADLGRFADIGGTVIHSGTTCVVIEDHHLRPTERVQFIASHVDLDEVTDTDITIFADITINCDAGVHEWAAVITDDDVDSTCVRCGISERTPRLPHWTGKVVRAPRMFYPK